MTQPTKPLFIPLKREWFEAFERGEKTVEYRAFGPGWNSTTCRPGRAVVLSFGYSGRRLSANIECLELLSPEAAPKVAAEFFPGKVIAAIHLRDIRPLA